MAAWFGASYAFSFWKKIVRPRSPFHCTSYLLKCSTNSPVASTSSPLTSRPVVGAVGLPAHPVAVVGPPDPGVVDDRVVVVDHHADGGLAGSGAADPDEHVVHGRRVGAVVGGRARPGRPPAGVGELTGPASIRKPASSPRPRRRPSSPSPRCPERSWPGRGPGRPCPRGSPGGSGRGGRRRG